MVFPALVDKKMALFVNMKNTLFCMMYINLFINSFELHFASIVLEVYFYTAYIFGDKFYSVLCRKMLRNTWCYLRKDLLFWKMSE